VAGVTLGSVTSYIGASVAFVGGDAIPELRSPTRSLSQRRNSTQVAETWQVSR